MLILREVEVRNPDSECDGLPPPALRITDLGRTGDAIKPRRCLGSEAGWRNCGYIDLRRGMARCAQGGRMEDRIGSEETQRMSLVLFTDLVDSTHLSAAIGDAAADALWADHDRAGRDPIHRWHGVEVGRSDGFLVMFDRAADGLGFALGYHAALGALHPPMSARVGAHWGRVKLRRNLPADVVGGATPFEIDGLIVPSAARLMSVARGGQTLFSAEALAALGNECNAPPHDVMRHGHWRLKGLPQPMELVSLSAPGAQIEPPQDAAKGYRVRWQDGLWIPVATSPGNLGSELDALVGREADLRALAEGFEAGARLITLVGPGGMGKTRLAQRYARSWRGDFPGGTWFCDLTTATGVDGIGLAVAQALDVPLGRADPVQQLGLAIAARGPCLVVLDNFEQLTAHAEATLMVWLRAAPEARLLVTSRELLALPGELVLLLDSLSVEAACQLFQQRARASGTLHIGDAVAVAQLVELLDCLPLAIELAAARSRVLSPAEQLRHIGARFRLLAVRGGQPSRHSTLRATIDWSWDLLTPTERSALAQLSVFEGGFTMATAEAVLDMTAAPQAWLPDVIQALQEKSLLRRTTQTRWDMLRSVHEYAAERLVELGGDALTRHWRHFAALTPTQALAEHRVEIDNLVAACRRATLAGQREIFELEALQGAAGALVNAWLALRLTGPFRVALELATQLLRASALPPGNRAAAQRVAGAAAALLGDLDAAASHYADGIDAAGAAGDPAQTSLLLSMSGELAAQRGRMAEAAELVQLGLHAAGVLALPRITALNALGGLALARSQPKAAADLYTQALTCAQQHAEERWVGGLHGSLGVALMALGLHAEARPHIEMAAHTAESMSDRQWFSIAKCNLGLLLHQLGEHDSAAEQLELVVEQARDMALRRLHATALCNLGLVELARQRPAAAGAVLHNALKLAEALNATRLTVQCLAYLVRAQLEQGDLAAASHNLRRAETEFAIGSDDALRVLLMAQRGLVLAASGDAAAADLLLSEADALAACSANVDSEARQALQAAQAALSRH